MAVSVLEDNVVESAGGGLGSQKGYSGVGAEVDAVMASVEGAGNILVDAGGSEW